MNALASRRAACVTGTYTSRDGSNTFGHIGSLQEVNDDLLHREDANLTSSIGNLGTDRIGEPNATVAMSLDRKARDMLVATLRANIALEC